MSAGEAPPTAPISVRGVSHWYGEGGARVHALADVDLTIRPGEFVCLAGPSGCGKTTLLQMMAGFLQPSAGQVLVGDSPVTAPAADRGVVFQQANLYPWLSVLGNVELGPRLRGVDKEARRETATSYLRMVGLEDFLDRKPYELSGGMQQRCQIARVLTNDPSIILMDEPFGALDALTRERLQTELLAIWRETRKTIFFITHSVEEALFLGSRVLVMSARPGRIVFDEPVDFSHARLDGLGDEMRALPEFVELRRRVSQQIYDAHG
ncbi:MAG: Taurine transporter ATP-binding protein [Frankiales bacterium]|nr:Taurine transporter ATP-binding protein [Frankiales bacterium]